jgi:hypothetical protein
VRRSFQLSYTAGTDAHSLCGVGAGTRDGRATVSFRKSTLFTSRRAEALPTARDFQQFVSLDLSDVLVKRLSRVFVIFAYEPGALLQKVHDIHTHALGDP